jgi:hypothetical protein
MLLMDAQVTVVQVTVEKDQRDEDGGGRSAQAAVESRLCVANTVPSVVRLSTREVALHLAEETARFNRKEPADGRFGVELFRRALVEQDEEAWVSLYAQYAPLISNWLHRDARSTPLFAREASGRDSLVNGAFAKFAAALAKHPWQFTSLAAILKYLKMCTHSTLLDELRLWQKLEGFEVGTPEELEGLELEPGSDDPADEVSARALSSKIWRILQYGFCNEQERLVIYLSFYVDMRPTEISRGYPHVFATPEDVHRIKRNVLERWRRDTHMRMVLRQLVSV